MMVPPSRQSRRRFCQKQCYSEWMAANLTGERAVRWGKGHTPETRARMSREKLARGMKGPKSPAWKGGRHLSNGYTVVSLNLLPPAEQQMFECMASRSSGRYVPEHRLVVARSIGRPLTRSEVVHHINGIKTDNRLENLELHGSSSSHQLTHAQIDAELTRLREENYLLRERLSRFCDVTALLAG